MRSKTESWQAIEASLSERALRAESIAEMAEHKKALLEEQTTSLKQQVSSLTNRLAESQANAQASEHLADRLRKGEMLLSDRTQDLESRLSLELGQKQSLQSSLRELEMRYKMDMQEAKTMDELATKKHNQQVADLTSEIEAIKEQLAAAERSTRRSGGGSGGGGGGASASSSGGGNASKGASKQMEGEEDLMRVSTTSKGYGSLLTNTLPSGDTSYAASERLHQQLHQRNEETNALMLQIQQMQASRDALLDEVSYLSSRNAQLEEESASVPHLSEEVVALRKRTELLLSLLGEKEEEVEASLADMREVKTMYRAQMDSLLLQITSQNQSPLKQ